MKTDKTYSSKLTVTTFILFTLLFSSVFWYLPHIVAESSTISVIFSIALMFCPFLAAILTRLIFQRNLKGFGIRLGQMRWLFLGMLLPVLIGLLMFGSAWTFGIAPLDTSKLTGIFSLTFIPNFLLLLALNCFASFGEEIGWRGFLVPELSRSMSFTKLALLSSSIWTVWHLPPIIFGSYHGTGPLWYSLIVFIPSVISAGVILAWLRLKSGSIWPAILFHGFWNYFTQTFYPSMTVKTTAGDMMLGEFGWFVAIIYILLALGFWFFRKTLPIQHTS